GSMNGQVIRMDVVGGNPTAAATGLDPLATRTNYLIGNDPSQWHSDITNYGAVRYGSVYDGIDLVYHNSPDGQLEYDFVLAPGADAGTVRLNFEGADSVSLGAGGELVLHTANGTTTQSAPVVYQDMGGVRQAIDGHYNLLGGTQVGFEVGAYDHSH